MQRGDQSVRCWKVTMNTRFLTALPVYNEFKYVSPVLDEVLHYSKDVLVVDDGSTDGTSDVLTSRNDIQVLRHDQNRGYGAALRSAFLFAQQQRYDVLVTIDCDGQHQPQRIPEFVAACSGVDIVSGSRYLQQFDGDSLPPAQRRRINMQITKEINERLGLRLTDAFCGFKAYRVSSLKYLNITELGYAMPLQVWVQAAKANLKIVELAVPLIYLDETRSFGGALDDAEQRLAHYREVIDRNLESLAKRRTAEMLLELGCENEERAGCR
jgi:glycosyltransferase involved in cell wall biosynthesis